MEENDKREERIKEWFNELEPFEGDTNKIPPIPKTTEKIYKEVVIPNLIRCGAIPKKDLIIGQTYLGDCRNAEKAVWKGDHFTYRRIKFGMEFDEDINHFEDDNGYDLFVPIALEEK